MRFFVAVINIKVLSDTCKDSVLDLLKKLFVKSFLRIFKSFSRKDNKQIEDQRKAFSAKKLRNKPKLF